MVPMVVVLGVIGGAVDSGGLGCGGRLLWRTVLFIPYSVVVPLSLSPPLVVTLSFTVHITHTVGFSVRLDSSSVG